MCTTAATIEVANDRHLLPTNVRPRSYDLTLTPDLTNFVFDGEVRIRVDVIEATNTIALNYKELELHHATVTLANGSTHNASEIGLDQADEVVTLHFAETIAPEQTVFVSIKFTGILNDKMAGFYRSAVVNEKGETIYMATTQMQPADARRAFPCWDEVRVCVRSASECLYTRPHVSVCSALELCTKLVCACVRLAHSTSRV